MESALSKQMIIKIKWEIYFGIVKDRVLGSGVRFVTQIAGREDKVLVRGLYFHPSPGPVRRRRNLFSVGVTRPVRGGGQMRQFLQQGC